jgi:hypothetical protein
MFKYICLIMISYSTLCGCTTSITARYRDLERAEGLLSKGQFGEAISIYQNHINYRLNLDQRASWENPYFYLLLIGDIELNRRSPDAAYVNYKQALSHGVDKNLISDRIRSLSHWYEEQGNIEKSIELLKLHRELDPLLFDAILDRLARKLTEKEEVLPS